MGGAASHVVKETSPVTGHNLPVSVTFNQVELNFWVYVAGEAGVSYPL